MCGSLPVDGGNGDTQIEKPVRHFANILREVILYGLITVLAAGAL